ncbi:hypothetical protein [Thalassospira profundimaris]|nr:hypothetical protein [Thalassospira profundimaris]
MASRLTTLMFACFAQDPERYGVVEFDHNVIDVNRSIRPSTRDEFEITSG